MRCSRTKDWTVFHGYIGFQSEAIIFPMDKPHGMRVDLLEHHLYVYKKNYTYTEL